MKLLIVDDEELIRLKLKHIASHPSLHFHSIETATNVFEALDSIKKEVPAVILSDIRMPQKSGLDLARYIHEQNLPSKIILITGFSDFFQLLALLQLRKGIALQDAGGVHMVNDGSVR